MAVAVAGAILQLLGLAGLRYLCRHNGVVSYNSKARAAVEPRPAALRTEKAVFWSNRHVAVVFTADSAII